MFQQKFVSARALSQQGSFESHIRRTDPLLLQLIGGGGPPRTGDSTGEAVGGATGAEVGCVTGAAIGCVTGDSVTGRELELVDSTGELVGERKA